MSMLKRALSAPGPCIALFVLALVGCSGYSAATSAEAQLEFGVDMARRGLWNEAYFRFHQADRLDPDNPKVLNNLAVASEATGRFEEALEFYRRALQLQPNDRELRKNYSRFIEFYQSLRAEEEGEESSGDGEEATTGEGGEP